MEVTCTSDVEIKSEDDLDSVNSTDRPTSTAQTKKNKTQADRQRQYRLRLKQKYLEHPEEKKATHQNRLDYQRCYRLQKRLEKTQNKEDLSVTPPLPKKAKTEAERQREYRLRKKMKLLNSQGDKLPKKTNADYQREYRMRKKLKAEMNAGSNAVIPITDTPWYRMPDNVRQLTPSSQEKERIPQVTEIEFLKVSQTLNCIT